MKGKFLLRNVDNGKSIEIDRFFIGSIGWFITQAYSEESTFYPNTFSAEQILDVTKGDFLFDTSNKGYLKKDITCHYEILSYAFGKEEKVLDLYSTLFSGLCVEEGRFTMTSEYFEINSDESLIGAVLSYPDLENRGKLIDDLKAEGYYIS